MASGPPEEEAIKGAQRSHDRHEHEERADDDSPHLDGVLVGNEREHDPEEDRHADTEEPRDPRGRVAVGIDDEEETVGPDEHAADEMKDHGFSMGARRDIALACHADFKRSRCAHRTKGTYAARIV